ncbi:MAG: thioredoxin fold domain-containing protein [Gammaproteobacteria bacterium]|nr:thioredoxin fold domain-containing protein [Gammaproteobacteria bacterium]MCY4275389.1 thioredoxin fold domain-containing protein [Gammaproteobacteria bacterium]
MLTVNRFVWLKHRSRMTFLHNQTVVAWLAMLLLSMPFVGIPSWAETSQRGEFFGAIETTHPDWFKESFLDFEEDIAEATVEDKRLVLYFHQDGCPYCNVLVEDNFKDPDILDFMQVNFDLVAINMWGDREVVQVGGQSFTEKTLASALEVNFTPTLLFFSEEREVVFRLDGYRPPKDFFHILNYVAEQREREQTFAEYLSLVSQPNTSTPLVEAGWPVLQLLDLSKTTSRPLAVLFEEPNCEACQLLHQKTFRNKNAAPILEQFTLVRYNRWSEDQVIRPDGTSSTIRQWSRDLGLEYAPAIVLYDSDGQQVLVLDAMFKTFHILGSLEYVASGAYRREPSLQRYLSERADLIRETGQDVDIWRY